MALVPSHFVWKRERSEHHSGAKRHYGDRQQVLLPRGPTAPLVPCALCTRGSTLHQGPRGSSLQTQHPSYPHSLTSKESLEKTPPRATTSRRKMVETQHQAQKTPCCCAGKAPCMYHYWVKHYLKAPQRYMTDNYHPTLQFNLFRVLWFHSTYLYCLCSVDCLSVVGVNKPTLLDQQLPDNNFS